VVHFRDHIADIPVFSAIGAGGWKKYRNDSENVGRAAVIPDIYRPVPPPRRRFTAVIRSSGESEKKLHSTQRDCVNVQFIGTYEQPP
jgi:hypothetical protein